MTRGETLETRTLLSVSSLLVGTELSIVSDDNDSITVRPDPIDPTRVQIVQNGQAATTVTGVRVTDIQSITIRGGSGPNLIDLSQVSAATFPNLTSVSVNGGDGDDTILGTADIGDTIFGSDGNDSIIAGAGSDHIDSGDGHDTVSGGEGDNTIIAGDGNDLVVAGAGADSIKGGDGDDTLSAGAGEDTVSGGDGADLINGNDGDDLITGGFGDNTLFGDSGNDSLTGGANDDLIGGGVGDDVLFGNQGNDTLNGEDGADSISGGSGSDVIDAGADDDTIDAGVGNDHVIAGDGNDLAYGGGGRDLVEGGNGQDLLFGNSGNDTLRGGAGQDSLIGSRGNDLLEGNDTTIAPVPTNLIPRLYAAAIDGSNAIVELDPNNGQEIRRFAAPEPFSGGPDGLAFDGTRLFYLAGNGTDMLYELNPDTGAVVDQDPITVGSTNYDGLALLGGMVYILDLTSIDIHVFDPNSDTVVNTLNVNLQTPTVSPLSGGLSAIANPDRLIATEAGGQRLLEIDPATGAVTASFSPNTPNEGSYLGAAVINGNILLGSINSNQIDIFSRSGLLLRTLTLPYGVTALGADDLGTVPITTTTGGSTGPTASSFEIELVIDQSFSANQAATFRAAAQRWERIITQDIPDVFVPGFNLIDDLRIDISQVAIDGLNQALASSTVIASRADSNLPALAAIQFDSADVTGLELSGQLTTVALHEIGHSLGFNSVTFAQLGLITGAGSADPRFTGSRALVEYNSRFNINEGTVPLQGTGGPGIADTHWRESVFGNELMSPFIDAGANPLTRLTVGALQDLGYRVDFGAADPDTLGSFVSGLNVGGGTRAYGSNGPLGQFIPLGPSGTTTITTVAGSVKTVTGYGIFREQQPMMVQPGIDADKFAPDTALGKQLLAELQASNGTGAASNVTSSITIPEAEQNDSLAGAFNLDNSGFSLLFDTNIGDTLNNTSTAIPNISITGTGNGTYDYYSFTVNNVGDRGIFDIDFGADAGGGFVDTSLVLFDPSGNVIDMNDEPISMTFAVGADGSTSTLDPFFEHTFAQAGLHVIGVAQGMATAQAGGIDAGRELPVGSTYTLQISIENHTTGIVTTPLAPPAIPAQPGDFLDGSEGDDTLIGSELDDILIGNFGNDQLNGGDGQDSLFGSAGRDSLSGDGGNDFLRGNSGRDTNNGGSGDDESFWRIGDGNDLIQASAGLDTVNLEGTSTGDAFSVAGSAGILQVSSNGQTVSIEDDTAVVNVNGNGGADLVTVRSVTDVSLLYLRINGGAGSDLINGGGADIDSLRIELNGGDGTDIITGTNGDETIRGGNGNDVIDGRGGNDEIDGGFGDDQLSGSAGNDVLTGGSGIDVLNGGDGQDVLDGGRGNDTLNGDAGDDVLSGSSGDDVLNGGDGNDTASGSSGNDVLRGGSGADFLNAGTDDDQVFGGGGNDTIRGGDGNDTIMAGEGDDIVNAGDGDDTINAGLGNDAVDGSDGNDTILGDMGNDTLVGGDGNDIMTGAAGRDIVLGGDGNDAINGNGSFDTLAGGEGIDNIIIAAAVGNTNEINENFVLGQDVLNALLALPPA
jgi:Ca2+-binding RTX toxin-like protein